MKLSKAVREQIISAAMSAAFKERYKGHDINTRALADALFTQEYGKAETIAKKLPAGWVSRKSNITIQCDGFGWNKLSIKHSCLPLSSNRLGPQFHSEVKVDHSHKLYKHAAALAAEYAELESDREQLHSKLSALVYSANTVARLLELWPEAQLFMPQQMASGSTALVPVGLADEVNKLLGINRKAA